TGAAAATAAEAAAAADVHTADVALADGGVPAGLDLAGVAAARDAVVDDDVRRLTGDGAVLVAECRAEPAGIAAGVVGEPALRDGREIRRLRVDELHALDGVLRADREARVHQVRDRARLAPLVVLVVHERRVLDRVQKVVELV